jgi:hypothetical protein
MGRIHRSRKRVKTSGFHIVFAHTATFCAILRARWKKRLSDQHPMNAPTELSIEEMLRIRLVVLQREHRDLDEAIQAVEARVNPDQLMLRRLKKQKLQLKEKIVKIEDELIPDIIA